jgi:hypothetical protein
MLVVEQTVPGGHLILAQLVPPVPLSPVSPGQKSLDLQVPFPAPVQQK